MNSRFRFLVVAALTLLIICASSAFAEASVLRLPANIEVVGEQAFYQATSMTKVVVPEGMTTIESKAFAYSSLREIEMPASISYIAEDAFEGCGELSAVAPEGSYAYMWCVRHGFIDQPAATPGEDFTYEPINGLYARITGYTGNDALVVIPEEIDDYIVQVIGTEAFFRNGEVTYIVVPDTVLEIQEQAFSWCPALQAVDLGSGVTTLGDWVFYDDKSLRQIDFPQSVTTMGQGVLEKCESLGRVGYPINWESASPGGRVFADCPKLTEIDVPEGTTIIPNYAFANCPNLKKINLPEGLLEIWHHAFSNCTGLTEMIYPSTIKTVGGINGCTSITEVVIPEGAEIIGTNAFDSVPLKKIIIPDSVTEVLDNAFQNCSNLETVDFGDGILSIGSYAFNKCTAVEKLLLPDSVEIIGDYAFANCSNLSEFHYPINWNRSNSDRCGHNFDNCTKLRSIQIPEGAIAIPRAAFAYASYLRYVTIPNTMKEIGDEAFKGCTAITSLEFNDGIEIIGVSAFEDCSNLTTAELPDSVTDLYSKAFKNCSKLNSFRYPINWVRVASKSDINYNDGFIFQGCVSLTQITIPEGVENIPTSAFNGASYIKTISFPSTLKSIGSCGLRGCSGLSTLSFPDGLLSLGDYSLENCTGIAELNLPDSVTKIGGASFRGCSNLNSFHYPQNWTSTSYYMYDMYSVGYIFDNCPKLTSIVMPEGITVVPADAFAHCRYLQTVYVPVSVTKVVSGSLYGGGAFDDSPNLTIHCEYGSYILKYAKDKNIPYYYLTPDGVNSPSGTLYKGDSYALYGYARSSVNLTEVNATIWDGEGVAIKKISVNPAVTDYNLAGTVNTSLTFGDLALGSYRYTLTAKTDISEEVWADNRFTIVPPPLRIYNNSINVPDGLVSVGEPFSYAGIIQSNYAITNVMAQINDINGLVIYQYNANPGSMSFDLSVLNSQLPVGKLNGGSYTLKIDVTSNGETRTAITSAFEVAELNGQLSEEDTAKILKFVKTDSNRNLFDCNTYINAVLGDMDALQIAIMSMNSPMKWTTGYVQGLIEGNPGVNEYAVDLYRKEIVDSIASMHGVTDLVSKTTEQKTKEFFAELGMDWGMDMLGEFTKDTEHFTRDGLSCLKTIEDGLKDLKSVHKAMSMTEDYLDSFTKLYLTAENGFLIIDSMANSGNAYKGNNEFEKAIRVTKQEYEAFVNEAIDNLFVFLVSEIQRMTGEQFSKTAASLILNAIADIKPAEYAMKVGMKMTGLDSVAKNYQSFMIQTQIQETANSAYKNAFDAVNQGDTSSSALSRLKVLYSYAGQTSKTLCNTILDFDFLYGNTYPGLYKIINIVDKNSITA